MNIFKKKKSIITISGIALLTGVMSVGLSACSNNYSGATVVQSSARYYPYDYYYYPYSSVYFHISTGYYHYYDGGSWIKVRTLPSRYILDSSDRVRVMVKSDRPYISHNKHRVRYTPRPSYRVNKKRDIIERRNNKSRFKNYRKQ